MHRRDYLRSIGIVATLVMILPAGCATSQKPPGVPVADAWEHPDEPLADPASRTVTPTGDTVSPAAPPPIAYVNGTPIARDRLIGVLLDAHGAQVIELLIRLELAQEQAQSMGLDVGPADVQAEYERALRRVASPVLGEAAADIDRQTAERLLSAVLARRGVSRAQFMLKVEQDAHLRKIAARDVSITDDMLPAEHDRTYGARVQIRHLQCGTLEHAARVRRELEAGADFELLVHQHSQNELTAPAGGLLPAFSRHDDVPALLRDTAFALEPGDVSDTIYEDGVYQIIKLERRFPPSQVSPELVADELRARLKQRLVEERMEQLAAQLFDDARIDITDPELQRRFTRRNPDRQAAFR